MVKARRGGVEKNRMGERDGMGAEGEDEGDNTSLARK